MLRVSFIRWLPGAGVSAMSVEEEDLRRCHRERDRLIRERTAHINRIKGLLFGQGIRGINVKTRYKTLKPSELVTGDGRPLPERLGREITREIERLAQVQAQIVVVERERDHPVTSCEATERKRHDLLRLKGLGLPYRRRSPGRSTIGSSPIDGR